MDIHEYFALRETPSANSPVGRLMLAVLGKFPSFTFEQARTKANDLLAEAGRKRVYRVPPVLTDEEQAERFTKVRERFAKPQTLPNAA